MVCLDNSESTIGPESISTRPNKESRLSQTSQERDGTCLGGPKVQYLLQCRRQGTQGRDGAGDRDELVNVNGGEGRQGECGTRVL